MVITIFRDNKNIPKNFPKGKFCNFLHKILNIICSRHTNYKSHIYLKNKNFPSREILNS